MLLTIEVCSVRTVWSVNLLFNPLHLPHIAVIRPPSVPASYALTFWSTSWRLANLISVRLTKDDYMSARSSFLLHLVSPFFFYALRLSDVCLSIFLKFRSSEVKVEMTAPVTCRVDPGAGPACESQFTVAFYIPDEHQDNPPEPSDSEVFLEHRKEFTAYVR